MKKPPLTAADPNFPQGLRRYLYLTAALTGAAILIVEILGAKMLSPYVGTSHFVWTAQIATTLIALAAGYYLGGRLVDKSPRLSRLYNCILWAAVYLSLTILLCEPIAYRCLRFNLALGALLTSALLFFVPLTLLAMVGPFLVRILVPSLAMVGGQTGRISAVSTLGSVAGTVLIGYVLIPFLRNSVTMYLTAGLLMALVFGYYVIWGKKSRQQAGIYVLILAGLIGGLGGVRREQVKRWATGEELYRANSNFGLLQVMQAKGSNRRFYLNDFLVQNTYDPESKQSLSMFTYMLHDLARAYTPALKEVLCIGMGVGIVPRQFAAEGASVDVMEINPAVVPLAEKYFDLPSGRFNLVIGDGRYFINRSSKKYHAIVLDAFLGESSPSHLMTKEAFAAMQHILRPEGVLVINSFGEFRTGRDFFTASLEKTLRTVFRSVRVHHAGNGNVFFVASDQSDLKVLNQPNLEQVHPSCRYQVEAAFDGLTQSDPQHGIVLTDDFNPVDFYDAANREAIRRHLAASMRTM